ncbi:hypothetical protein [Amycolatopsis japonica]|uniref:hypothetical protein n=1 Tax=Amycolatopsis japonica TaxID=208439 RepID=UPI0033C85FBA
MDQAEAIKRQLVEMRQGAGLNKEGLHFAPDAPLCIAFMIPRYWNSRKREECIKQSIRRWLRKIDNERLRRALEVAYNLDEDHSEKYLKLRRESYAKSIPCDPKTVERDEDKAISILSTWLAKEPTPVLPGRKFRISRTGAKVPLWVIRMYKLIAIILALFLAIYIGAATGTFYVVPAAP